MKKILGVSIAAMLAVTPMMAGAANTATAITGGKITAPTAEQIAADKTIATTSYVKGAYADIATEHNKVVSDITVNTTEANNITSAATIGGNVRQLDTAIGNVSALATGATADSTLTQTGNAADLVTAVRAINNALAASSSNSTVSGTHNYISNQSVSANLGALDVAVKNNSDAIGASNAASIATALGTTNYLTGQTTVVGATKALDSQAKTNADAIAVLNLTDSTATGYANSVSGKIKSEAQSATYNANTATTEGTLGYAIKQLQTDVSANQGATTVENGSFITAAGTVSDNLEALDEAAAANSRAVSAILNSQITVYGGWNNGAAPNGSSTISIGSLQGSGTGLPVAPAELPSQQPSEPSGT